MPLSIIKQPDWVLVAVSIGCLFISSRVILNPASPWPVFVSTLAMLLAIGFWLQGAYRFNACRLTFRASTAKLPSSSLPIPTATAVLTAPSKVRWGNSIGLCN